MVAMVVLGALTVDRDASSVALLRRYVDGALELEVTDGGAGEPGVRAPGPGEESGRGLVIVTAVAERWGVRHTGTCVWAEVVRKARVRGEFAGRPSLTT